FTNRQGPPGSETDDLIPVSGPNFATTLSDPGDLNSSDYGAICVDFVDPILHLPRTVEYAEVWFLDVEDSIGRLGAFPATGCSGHRIQVAETTEDGDKSQVRVSVGAVGSGAEIGSMLIEFGDSSDSAAVDQLCFEFTGSRVTIDDGMPKGTVLDVVG